MHNPDTRHCTACPLFAECAVAVVETRKRLDALMASCKAVAPPKRARKPKVAVVEPDEVEIVLPDAAPPPEIAKAFADITALPDPEPPPLDPEPVQESEPSTPPEQPDGVDGGPETTNIDGIHVELAELKVNPRKKLLAWAKRGVKLQALQRGTNPFAEGEGFMRIACQLLLDRKSFPQAALESELIVGLKWSPGSAKSHRLIVVDTLKACGLIDYNPHGGIVTLRELA